MKEFQVLIPEEYYSILNFEHEDLPGVAVVNTALRDFEPKEAFDYHLSVKIDLVDLVENGMPSKDEVRIIDDFGDYLDGIIKGPNLKKPNALFLARITHNKVRELIWRVFDSEEANKSLSDIIVSKDYPREFEYFMEHDPSWKQTRWYLKNIR